jgi:hypothetical protein
MPRYPEETSMAFSRASLTSLAAAQCLIAGLAPAAYAADGSGIPGYFFHEWTVSSNCVEESAGLAAQVPTGLKFRISQDTLETDGSYVFEAEDASQQHWAKNWNGSRLEYRPGTVLTTLPADFECIPGQPPTSSFLTMSGYAVSAEPYYEQQHWYGIAKIHGQLEHVLIFPVNSSSGASAVVVLQSANAPTTVQLDSNGVIHAQ